MTNKSALASPPFVKTEKSSYASDIKHWLSKLVLGVVANETIGIFSTGQLSRLKNLSAQARKKPYKNPHPTCLFPSSEELFLGKGTVITEGMADLDTDTEGEEILLQLLPYWIELAQGSSIRPSPKAPWGQELLGPYEISSNFSAVIDRVRLAKSRTSLLINSRVTQFSRSAHYMGSKAFFAPYLSEIVHTLLPKDTVIVDLMCGSGAASGYFSRSWRTIASDAQEFSRLLAKVQGGGSNSQRALKIADTVLNEARAHYEKLPPLVLENIEIENNFLASELSPLIRDALYNWISTYPRINNQKATNTYFFSDLIVDRKSSNSSTPYILFSSYYANLFFGVRQAAEIDSLRYAIDQIDDTEDRAWALGALICATSSCAYSYGGHFAQPKFDGEDLERFNILVPDLVVSRGLSVSHEFFVRLTSLGDESSKALYPVQSVDGPWENAIAKILDITNRGPVCVYLDPPYTRDEYSRYYHLLETLVRYDYPEVRDKASMPKRGDAGRFASDFATRNNGNIESLIVEIIKTCVEKGWCCLWSYSSVGVASIENILERLSPITTNIDIFGMNHSYKGQGKHKPKPVREYAILIRP
jgi:adenine-specific DNA methylase